MQPSEKSHTLEKFLEEMAGRSSSIRGNRCVSAPIGCGEPIGRFRDEPSRKEYTISGLCQNCQDEIWPPVEDAEDDSPDG